MESVLVKVVSFIAVIVVGYLLKRVGFFRAEDLTFPFIFPPSRVLPER